MNVDSNATGILNVVSITKIQILVEVDKKNCTKQFFPCQLTKPKQIRG